MSATLLEARRQSQRPLLNLAEFDRLTALRGWDTDVKRCRALDVQQPYLCRVRNGTLRPNAEFIHRCMTVLRVPYEVLFLASTRKAAA